MNLDDLFVDPQVADDGVWVEFYGGAQFKLASMESPKYKALMASLARKNRIQLDDSNENSTEVVQKITAEALSKAVLKDWKNVTMNGVENVPYTPELGAQAILRSSKVREFVTDRANDPSLFKKKLVETVEKPYAGS